MKTKTILYIIGAVIVIVFATVSGSIALFPLTIGIILLLNFKKDDFAKYIGFMSLKTVFVFFLVFVVRSNLLDQLSARYSFESVLASLWFVPELTLTLVVFYAFRQLIRSDQTALMFLIGDIIRWSSLSIEALIPDPFPEPYFYTQFYMFVFFAVLYPSLYSIGGLITVIRHVNRQKDISLSNNLS